MNTFPEKIISSNPIVSNHIKMLYDISELTNLFDGVNDVDNLLLKIVNLISEHIQSDVCSIYLYNDDTDELILKATKGLSVSAINNIKLKPGEGIAGAAFKFKQTICEADAEKSSYFKPIEGINEEKFKAYLTTPIYRGNSNIGIITLQRKGANIFNENDIISLKAISSQLAATIDTARLLLINNKEKKTNLNSQKNNFKYNNFINLKIIKCDIASSGYAYAKSIFINRNINEILMNENKFTDYYDIKKFENAVEETEKQLTELQFQVNKMLDDTVSLIFTAHLLILKDKNFTGKMRHLINGGFNASNAIIRVGNEYIKIFSKNKNPLIKEKIADIKDLIYRLLNNLVKETENSQNYSKKIILADELVPSDIIKFWSEKVQGIILISGGIMSHLSILASSLQIPMVISNTKELLTLPDNTDIIIDAEIGNIYITPDKDVVKLFQEKNKSQKNILQTPVFPETFSKDKMRIHIFSNINLLSEINIAKQLQSEGVGLYRTEFPFLIRDSFPSEEEQFFIYKKLIEYMPGKPITFRTLDIGGDKLLSYFHNSSKEKNPFLGLRSIRFSLIYKEIFSQQIKAILRAGYNSKIKIMFPMLSSLDELIESKKIIASCMSELAENNIKFNNNPEIGFMIEVPSVMLILEELFKISDFASIGTNDFVQYLIAVDRTNEKVSHLYSHHHPSVLRALNQITQTAINLNKEISICGEMAH
ncbi:phosphoenolpyruvate--protein phosphotransferase, partial [Candidatus Dependentiae bacterium]|nr:phosphoenolpyruvate--protein phosphotransferase [Candidatus Dependentiae bacterium]